MYGHGGLGERGRGLEGDVDGVGGLSTTVFGRGTGFCGGGIGGAWTTKEGIEMDSGSMAGGVFRRDAGPFGRERDGMGACDARDGVGQDAGKAGGAIGEEIEFVVGVGIAARQARVEVNDDALAIRFVGCLDFYRGDDHRRHGAVADDDTGIVDGAVGGEAAFVDATEMQIGIRVIAAGRIGQPDFVGCRHVGR